jgi:hypothetical protein
MPLSASSRRAARVAASPRLHAGALQRFRSLDFIAAAKNDGPPSRPPEQCAPAGLALRPVGDGMIADDNDRIDDKANIRTIEVCMQHATDCSLIIGCNGRTSDCHHAYDQGCNS